MLGLGSSLHKAGKVGKSIVRDGLVLEHGYSTGAVEPCSTGAASFNGASDYIQLANAISYNVFSISAWINVTGDATTKTILDTREDSDDGVFFFLTSDEQLVLYVNDLHSNAIYLTAGVWQHVVGTYDGTSIKLYVDGVLVETRTPGGDSETVGTGTAARIGKSTIEDDNEFFGYMANVGVWSAALTQAQVKSIMLKDYAALSASEKTNLVSWWNLDEETATDGTAGTGGVKDHEGSNHGTLA